MICERNVKMLKQRLFILKIYLKSFSIAFFLLTLVIAIAINPKESFDAALNGINMCINVVFPSLFPFLVVTYLFIHIGMVHILGVVLEPIMRPIFNVPGSGSFAFAMGIISGYPIGAKTTADLWKKKLCSTIEGERLLTFCNNSGPLFILGAVAVGMFKKPALGFLLYLVHFLAAVSVGVCFRFYKYNVKRNPETRRTSKSIINSIRNVIYENKKNFGELLGEAIKNAVNLLLVIGGFIVFFSVLIKILGHFKILSFISKLLGILLIPIGFPAELMPAMASGLFEITNGIKMAAECSSPTLIYKATAASLILGWAGFSVHFQVMNMILHTDMRIVPYLGGKALHAAFSAVYTYILLKYFPMNIDVSLNLTKPFYENFHDNVLNNFWLSLIYIGNTLIFLTFLCFLIVLLDTIRHKN